MKTVVSIATHCQTENRLRLSVAVLDGIFLPRLGPSQMAAFFMTCAARSRPFPSHRRSGSPVILDTRRWRGY
jgi:hypothetical protein